MYRLCVATIAAALFLFSFSPFVMAGDMGLYPSAPPPGSAFIRLLNGDNSKAAQITVRGKDYGAAQIGAATPYIPTAHGAAEIKFGPATATADLKEGGHYAGLLVKGVLSILEEPDSDNPMKAEIILINASSRPGISLKTPDGSVSIVDSLEPGQLGGRAVNAVQAPLSIYAAGKKIEDISARPLERGARYAVLVYDDKDGKPAVTFN